MKCCTNCFRDPFLKRFIKTNGNLGNCYYCNEEGVKTIDVQQIAEMFDIFHPYYEKLEHGENFIHHVQDPTDVGEFLYELIQSDWEVFADDSRSLFNDIMELSNYNYYSDQLYVKAVESFTYESSVEVWQSFSDEIKHGNRFFTSKGYITENLIKIFKENTWTLYKNAVVYRGRIGNYDISTMGAPPSKYASPGRANPKGISYLYTADKIETVIAELRPYKSALISIVEINAKQNLNLVSLNVQKNIISPLQFSGSLLEGVETIQLLSKLVTDLSKPVAPENSEIDYLPTQFLAELIKSEGYDGFIFKSALGHGDNIVIFNEENVERISMEYYEVNMISYNFKPTLF